VLSLQTSKRVAGRIKTLLKIGKQSFSAASRWVEQFCKNCGNFPANSEDGGARKKQVQKSWLHAPIDLHTID
jgi:hypothetical protein